MTGAAGAATLVPIYGQGHIPMGTINIRFEGDLKARVAATAELGKTTSHAFILSAIAM